MNNLDFNIQLLFPELISACVQSHTWNAMSVCREWYHQIQKEWIKYRLNTINKLPKSVNNIYADERYFLEFIKSPTRLICEIPVNSYRRQKLHYLADIYGIKHKSIDHKTPMRIIYCRYCNSTHLHIYNIDYWETQLWCNNCMHGTYTGSSITRTLAKEHSSKFIPCRAIQLLK